MTDDANELADVSDAEIELCLARTAALPNAPYTGKGIRQLALALKAARQQMSLTREWLNAWEAGLFTADQCWIKLRSKLAERKDY